MAAIARVLLAHAQRREAARARKRRFKFSGLLIGYGSSAPRPTIERGEPSRPFFLSFWLSRMHLEFLQNE